LFAGQELGITFSQSEIERNALAYFINLNAKANGLCRRTIKIFPDRGNIASGRG